MSMVYQNNFTRINNRKYWKGDITAVKQSILKAKASVKLLKLKFEVSDIYGYVKAA